jgi:mannose-6-phosphate isomerase-like protein (cupin superfamily)
MGRMTGAHRFQVRSVLDRLEADGGYEIVHESPNVEVGVYVLVAPEPDRQQPHAYDEVYVVLEGRGVLTVEGEDFRLTEGDAIFVPAGAEHQFIGYEELSVLVFFAKTNGSGERSMLIR